MLKTSDFDFNLPANLIATKPFFPKEETKMLIYDNNNIYDKQVINLVDYLNEGDLLVFNDAKVIKAKLKGRIKRNSAILEFNLDQLNDGIWNALCKPAKKVIKGDEIEIADNFRASVKEKNDDGTIGIEFNATGDEFAELLEKFGEVPLPPYIKREKEEQDNINYQTIYAKSGYAVAAPTAGLHFNQEIFNELEKKKINKAFVTLNVGAGTFLPVRSDNICDHKMHFEYFTLSEEAAALINLTKKNNKRVIAVGTTSLRVLESAAIENGVVKAGSKNTDIFIYPPYDFKIIDGLMTNFHLPKSTLFMLICAFMGKDAAFKLYNHAIKNDYRFYSYGDATLLL